MSAQNNTYETTQIKIKVVTYPFGVDKWIVCNGKSESEIMQEIYQLQSLVGDTDFAIHDYVSPLAISEEESISTIVELCELAEKYSEQTDVFEAACEHSTCERDDSCRCANVSVVKRLLEKFAGSYDLNSLRDFARDVNANVILDIEKTIPKDMRQYYQFDADGWITKNENKLFETHIKDGKYYIFWC